VLWTKFADRVGWRKGGEWVTYWNLTFNNAEAPKAHLPTSVMGIITGGWIFSQHKDGKSNIFSRAKACNL
jgi:hypothetical protein